MVNQDTRIDIEKEYFNLEFQNLNIIDKENSIRERLKIVVDRISELQIEKADLQRWLGQ